MNIETSKVRIISNKYGDDPKANEMIGGEYKIKYSNYHSNTVTIIGNDGPLLVNGVFNKSDVRFLTPIEFKDRHIAIGDWIKISFNKKWFKVISFGQTSNVNSLLVKDNTQLIVYAEEDEIQDHDPGIETDEYIEIDGEKWSKSTIKEALKNKLNL